MKVVSNFIIDPCEFQRPAFRISPFTTADVSRNAQWPASSGIDDYFANRYPQRAFAYTRNGREAIYLALQSLNLAHGDCVTILTTTGNHYISGCVTKEIEKFCHWSRQFESSTKVLFVNHEFGFGYEKLAELKKHGVCIIEDICHSFASNNSEDTLGKIGDFVIASFPKYFPIQCGALLWHDRARPIQEMIDPAAKAYCQTVLSHYQGQIAAIAQQRRANHEYMARRFSERGLRARFSLADWDVPGAFMFVVAAQTDLAQMKAFLARQGIQGGGFHKESTYFVPVHQQLGLADMDYICEVAAYYLRENGLLSTK